MAYMIKHLSMHNDVMSAKDILYKYAFQNCTKDKTRRKWYEIVTNRVIFASLYPTATLVAALRTIARVVLVLSTSTRIIIV